MPNAMTFEGQAASSHPGLTQAASPELELTNEYKGTTERFVAFLDIMGFKDRVARNTHDAVLYQLESFQNSISGYVREERSSVIKVALFSDSVLLFSNDGSEKSLKAISEVTKKIMLSALQQKVPIPLKGAIAKGTVTCDDAKQLYFGQALIDAYTLEENIKYYGVLVHHTAESEVKKLAGETFRDVKAFLKSGRVSHYELNWYPLPEAGDDCDRADGLENWLENLRLTVSDEPRKYIDNTLAIYHDGLKDDSGRAAK